MAMVAFCHKKDIWNTKDKLPAILGLAEINKIAKSIFLKIFFTYNFPEKDVYSWTLQCEIHEVSSEGTTLVIFMVYDAFGGL